MCMYIYIYTYILLLEHISNTFKEVLYTYTYILYNLYMPLLCPYVDTYFTLSSLSIIILYHSMTCPLAHFWN